MIPIIDEQIESRNTLPQSALNLLPIRRLNNARNYIKEDAFYPSVVPIAIERNTKMQERLFGSTLTTVQFSSWEHIDALHQEGGSGTRHTVGSNHCVVRAFGLIA